jgi:hypothetical protein
MPVSYALMEDAWCRIIGGRVGIFSMFVSPRTFRDIVSAPTLYGPGSYLAGMRWRNPLTGRMALAFDNGYIERRRWMPDGEMMFHNGRQNLGSASICQRV